MWGVLGFLARLGTWVLDRFLPSRDRELGRAEADMSHMKESEDAKRRMEGVPEPSDDDVDRSLRDGTF